MTMNPKPVFSAVLFSLVVIFTVFDMTSLSNLISLEMTSILNMVNSMKNNKPTSWLEKNPLFKIYRTKTLLPFKYDEQRNV